MYLLNISNDMELTSFQVFQNRNINIISLPLGYDRGQVSGENKSF